MSLLQLGQQMNQGKKVGRGGAMNFKAGYLIDFPEDIQSQVPEVGNKSGQFI